MQAGIVGLLEDTVHRFVIASLLVLTSASPARVDARDAQAEQSCRPTGPLARIAELPEASGLAASRKVPGRLWAHNDSGQPVLFALDARGAVTGRLRLTGVKVEDWEAIAVGPCPAGSCIYVADIGDNDAARKQITVYRVPEPADGNGSVAVTDVFHARYPDGAHDAEALLVAGDGRLHVVTKGETGPIALYRFPSELRSGSTHQLERVGAPAATRPAATARITDGSVSPNGEWAALRTGSSIAFYRAADLLAGQWREVSRVDLASLKEPQGEGVALGNDNTVFLAGEGGGKNEPATFAHFTCAPRQ
jgi:hypothetical protein